MELIYLINLLEYTWINKYSYFKTMLCQHYIFHFEKCAVTVIIYALFHIFSSSAVTTLIFSLCKTVLWQRRKRSAVTALECELFYGSAATALICHYISWEFIIYAHFTTVFWKHLCKKIYIYICHVIVSWSPHQSSILPSPPFHADPFPFPNNYPPQSENPQG